VSIETLKNSLPDYAKDIKLNLSTLAAEEILNSQQLWGTFLAAAITGRNAAVIQAIEAEAAQKLSPEALTAAKAAASIMAMNNVYYKFTGMMGDDYRALPAKLRMSVIGNPGVDKKDFELWSLAVSAINGCQYCVVSHERKLTEEGVSREQIQAAVRIAAVLQAASAILDGAAALEETLPAAA
jgi:alkyl hydroperoxide reductase subunit D